MGDRSVREFLGGRRRGARQGAGRFAAAPAHRDAGKAADRLGDEEPQARSRHQPEDRRHRPGRGGGYHSLRRRSDRRHRFGQRGGDHRRIGAGHPRGGRRPLGGHRWHAGAVRLDSRADHGRAGFDLPRPHDPAGRGRRAPEDAERDRAQHPAGRHDDHLRVRHGDDPELRELRRRHDPHCRRGGAVRHPHSDHDRCAAFGHRHRRNGPSRALQRAGAVGPGGRGGGRCRHAAARQDRHHHARQSAGDRVQAVARRERAGIGGRRPARFALRRDARRALHRRARQGEVRHQRPRPGRVAGQIHSVHGAEPHERGRGGRARGCARGRWTRS